MGGSLHTSALSLLLLVVVLLATVAIAGHPDAGVSGYTGPTAVIQLDLREYAGNVPGDTHLQLDVLESSEPCGYGNVTLNGDLLPQDEQGRGSGPIVIDNGRIIVGNWQFNCVESSSHAEQLLRFNVVNLDGKPIEDVGFSALFHQQFPISVTYVDGAGSVINIPTLDEDSQGRKLDDEIVELARMKVQLLKLQEKISLKEKLLSDEFGYGREELEHAGCESFKCVFSSVWKKAHGRLSTYFRGHRFRNQHGGGRTQNQPVDEPNLDEYEGSIRVGHDDSLREQQSRLSPQGDQRHRTQPTITVSSSLEKERRLSAFKWAVIIAPTVLMILGLIFSLLIHPFCSLSRAQRSERREERRNYNRARRALAREHRVATKAAMRAKFGELMRRFTEKFTRRSLEDEEKESILRRLHASSSSSSSNHDNNNNTISHDFHHHQAQDSDDDISVSGSSDSDSDMSTTMEQDLASFRSVADVVGDMVMAAEEGRTRRGGGGGGGGGGAIAAAHHHHRIHDHPPFTPSPAYFASSRSRRSTFSDGISIDEELPAYEERPSRVSVDSASHVPNGIRYTPSGSSVTGSPLDEVFGRKAQI